MSRRYMALIVCFVWLLLPLYSSADELVSTNNAFELGMTYYKFDYKEDVDPPLKSTENGWLPGVYFGYTYNKKDTVYTKLFLEYSSGDIEYDGSTQSGTPIRFDDSAQALYRYEWNIGYTFSVSKDFSVTPFTGFGYRFWRRGKSEIRESFVTLQEEYEWLYIPVGLRSDITLTRRLSFEPSVGMRLVFDGTMTVLYSDIYVVNNDPELDLGNKIGWWAELPVRYRFAQYWSFVVTPWYAYSAIGKSNEALVTDGQTTLVVWEPSSRTHQYGLKFAIALVY